jgi:hypothetical protein
LGIPNQLGTIEKEALKSALTGLISLYLELLSSGLSGAKPKRDRRQQLEQQIEAWQTLLQKLDDDKHNS